MKKLIRVLVALLIFSACTTQKEKEVGVTDKRIVSLNGTITEVLFELGENKQLVGVDVTSTYPKKAEKIANLGHISHLNMESVLGLKPTHVLAFDDELDSELKERLKASGITVVSFKRQFTVNGAKQLILDIASWAGKRKQADAIVQQMDRDLEKVAILKNAPKVLFIYARGAGTLMVGGEGTPIEKVIDLAGGKNVGTGFIQYKPLTGEAVIAANPDVLLMFDSGAQSLGPGGVLDIPGVSLTNAGKNKRIVLMDGQLLSGFGPRLGKAVYQLNQALQQQ